MQNNVKNILSADPAIPVEIAHFPTFPTSPFGENWIVDPFSIHILTLRGNNSSLKNIKVAEATFNLQFDIAMVQNRFRPI